MMENITKRQFKGLVAVIGLPNVGKSTFFNRMIGERKSIVTDIAGTTRDNVFGKVRWQNNEFWLIDTAGIKGEKESDEMEMKIEEQIVLAADQADTILWMVDGSSDSFEMDLLVLQKYRRWMDKIVLVINKNDKKSKKIESWEYNKFGLTSTFEISSINGSGIGDLLDEVMKRLQKIGEEISLSGEDKRFRVCLVGRPNVGKSSLCNTFSGSEERVVSNVPGTTRDIGEIEIKYGKESFVLYDTAGLRRMGKVNREYIERFSIMRTISAMNRSDLAIVMLDAEEGLTRRDMALIGKVDQMKKAMILFVNKWDLKEENSEVAMKKMIEELRNKITFVYWVPVVFGSATKKLNIKPLLSTIRTVRKSYYYQASQESLDELVFELLTKNVRMSSMGLKKIEQIASGPPQFKFKLTNKKTFSVYDVRMLEDVIRDYLGLRGVAIVVKVI